MKKSIFTLGFLSVIILCLSACGNKKDFNMPFEEALELATHSPMQDVMTNADNAEQSFNIAGNYNKDDLKVDGKITSKSKQNLKDVQSESNIGIDFKMQEKENNLDLKGDLDIKFVPSAIYLSLNSLDIKGNESAESIGGIASGYLNKWFSIPLEDTIDINNLNMKDQFEISSKIKEVINNEGFQIYSGRFTNYNGYNARKISIDDEKLIKILKDSYNSTNNTSNDNENEEILVNEEIENSNTVPEENSEENIENNDENNVVENTESIDNNENNNDEIFEESLNLESSNVKIENFEGYLVLIGKDKVALAIENMDISENETTTNINGVFCDKEALLSVSSEGEELINLSVQKKRSHFNTTLSLKDLFTIQGTITPKVSSSKIDIDFDLVLTIESNGEEKPIIPLKGNWSYSAISEFKVEIPSESQDLTQIMGGLLGGMGMNGGESDFNYDDYDDYYTDYELDVEDSYNEELINDIQEDTNNENNTNEENTDAE